MDGDDFCSIIVSASIEGIYTFELWVGPPRLPEVVGDPRDRCGPSAREALLE